MVDSEDYEHIVSDGRFLEKNLPGRTIKKFDISEGEIYFEDNSVLTITWHPEWLGFELFEKGEEDV